MAGSRIGIGVFALVAVVALVAGLWWDGERAERALSAVDPTSTRVASSLSPSPSPIPDLEAGIRPSSAEEATAVDVSPPTEPTAPGPQDRAVSTPALPESSAITAEVRRSAPPVTPAAAPPEALQATPDQGVSDTGQVPEVDGGQAEVEQEGAAGGEDGDGAGAEPRPSPPGLLELLVQFLRR